MGIRRTRLDQLVVERGLAESRTRAQALILARRVRVEGEISDKAGHRVPDEATIELDQPEHPWVGRGGMKLAGALDEFGWRPEGQVAVDLGSSTGGFTDVLISRGAERVYAVDVGRGQLHVRLRDHPRVIVRERVNARYLSPEILPEPCSFMTADLSFISLTLVLPAVAPFLEPSSHVVVLVKPQFEAGRREVGKGGIVRDPDVRDRCLSRVSACAVSLGWSEEGRIESPIRGAAGNVEFLLGFRTSPDRKSGLPSL